MSLEIAFDAQRTLKHFGSPLVFGSSHAKWIFGVAFATWALRWLCTGVVAGYIEGKDAKKKFLKPVEAPKIATRLVSIVFATTSGLFALYILATCSPTLSNDLLEEDERVTALFRAAAGYFLFDIVVVLAESWPFEFLMHGVLCFLVFLGGLGPFLHHMGTICLLFELSTPFMHLRRLGIELGMGDQLWVKIVGWMFAGVFFLARICVGWTASIFWWGRMLELFGKQDLGVMMFYLTANLFLCGLNGWWFFQIVRTALQPGEELKKNV